MANINFVKMNKNYAKSFVKMKNSLAIRSYIRPDVIEFCRSLGKASMSKWESGKWASLIMRKNRHASFSQITAEFICGPVAAAMILNGIIKKLYRWKICEKLGQRLGHRQRKSVPEKKIQWLFNCFWRTLWYIFLTTTRVSIRWNIFCPKPRKMDFKDCTVPWTKMSWVVL